MKTTLSWLRDHLETGASAAEIAEALTMLGLEVESISDPAARLAGFSVARVVSVAAHPDASRLSLCQVEAIIEGRRDMVQVVCGAPNVRDGMKAVFAAPGTVIPGTGLHLKPGKIRGQESNGMLCSEREMELSDDHEGIIDLDESAELGRSFAEAAGLDDPVFDVAVTPNRPDCLGVRGLARDLAAAGIGHLTEGAIAPVTETFKSPVRIELEFAADEASACPFFAGRFIRGVTNGPSPDWMQRRLRAIGLRPINALVDVTNYLCQDRGRPLHVYDADKLSGNIRARMGRSGEAFRALDGRDYKVDGDMCVIADDSGVLGLGGIMGGEASGATAETRNVFVESALFSPQRTSQTGRRTGIESDARHRFERGVDPAFTLPGCAQAAGMIMELCGGDASDAVVCGAAESDPRTITFVPDDVARLCGVAVAKKKSAAILTSLGFSVEGDRVRVPSWRPDVSGGADLVEEVIRVQGLDSVPHTPMSRADAVTRPVLTLPQRRMIAVRRVLASRGLMEAVTWSFISPDEAGLFAGDADLEALRLANPIAGTLSVMRPGLLPGLLAAVRRNRDRGHGSVGLFEVGQQFAGLNPEDQRQAAGGVRSGPVSAGGGRRHWRDAPHPADVFHAKADALAALAAAGAPVGKLQTGTDAPGWYHPGRSGVLRLGAVALAAFGEIHPAVLEAMDVPGPVAGFEVWLEAVPQPRRSRQQARAALPDHALQAVRRDFAFLVPEDIAAEALVRAAGGADGLITDVGVFDVFHGPGVAEGMKSLAIEVTIQPLAATLTDAQIAAITDKVVAAVKKATGGTLRA